MSSNMNIVKTLFVGTDTSKAHIDVAAIDIHGRELLTATRYNQDKEGYEQCLETLEQICAENGYELRFGIESTGIYHFSFYDFLVEHGYQVRVFNGLEVRAFQKTRIRKTNTDKIAAKTIANALRFCFDPDKKTPLPNELRNLRELVRARQRHIKRRTRLANQITRNLDLVFPGCSTLYKRVLSKRFLNFLKEACTPSQVLEMGEKELKKLLPTKKTKRVIRLAEKAHAAVDFDQAVRFEIESLIRLVEGVQEEIKLFNKEIEREFNRLDPLIGTIPGIGPITGSTILTELGDISNFSSAKKIVGFAGLDSIIKSSGKFRGRYRISKCGSKYLRTALYQAAFSGCNCNPVLKVYYNRMVSKGKVHTDAVVCCARKLCHIVYSVLKNQKPFYVPSHIERTVQELEAKEIAEEIPAC